MQTRRMRRKEALKKVRYDSKVTSTHTPTYLLFNYFFIVDFEGRTMPPRSQQSGRAPTRPGTYTWEPPPPIPPVFDEVVNPRYRLPQRGRSITPPVNHYGAWFREGFGQVQQVVEEGPPGRSETPLIETSPVERRSWYQEVVNEAPPPVPMDVDPPFDATALGLKEIGNLASWTVSSCKPGCGVEALRDEDIGQFWQCVYQL
jgi:hypothetical protein